MKIKKDMLIIENKLSNAKDDDVSPDNTKLVSIESGKREKEDGKKSQPLELDQSGVIIERLEFPNEDSRHIDIVSDLSKEQIDSRDMFVQANLKAEQMHYFAKGSAHGKTNDVTQIQSASGDKKNEEPYVNL